MVNRIQEAVSVSLVFDHTKRRVYPSCLKWRGRVYKISQLGLHHFFRRGRTLIHVFTVSSHTTSFRLELDTYSLHWHLTEVSSN